MTGTGEEDARAEAREQIEIGGFVAAVAERIGLAAGVAAVFGEPVQRDGVTVIPVARAAWGAGGGGGGKGEDEGHGAGGGAIATPHGFIEIGGGKARYRRVPRPMRLVLFMLGTVLTTVAAAVLLLRRQS